MNLLPRDGNLTYQPDFYSPTEASELFARLRDEVPWKSEKIKMFGRELAQPRLTAWFSDPGKSYTYSGITNHPQSWTPLLRTIKEKVEFETKETFNSLLLNYYRSGVDHMGWHTDDEPELGKNPVIASLSFGEVRRFQLKHRREKDSLQTFELASGSLVLMSGPLQHHWVHRIAPTTRPLGGRINLTFRKIL